MADANSEQAWVWLARIRKAQGRKGEVFAELLTDFPEKFEERTRVWLLKAAGVADDVVPDIASQAEVTGYFLHKAGVVLRLAGINSIPEADALRGLVVAIPRKERVALGEDEVYVGDLIGCLLVDVASEPVREIGIIKDVDRDAGPVALLVVATRAGEVLVPFAKAYLRQIDLVSKRVEMALPEGLVEVQLGE